MSPSNRLVPKLALGAIVGGAILALGGCSTERNYLPGLVDDALFSTLINGPVRPPRPFHVSGGSSPNRGCRTVARAPAAPGTRFRCEEDFGVPGRPDSVVERFGVTVDQRGCWTASQMSIYTDAETPTPVGFPSRVTGCGIPPV